MQKIIVTTLQFPFSDVDLKTDCDQTILFDSQYSTSASFSLKQIASTLKLRQFRGLVLPVLSELSIGCTTSQNSFCLHGIDEFEWNLIWRVYNFTEKKFAISIIINTQGRVHNVILGNRMQYMKTTISTTKVLVHNFNIYLPRRMLQIIIILKQIEIVRELENRLKTNCKNIYNTYFSAPHYLALEHKIIISILTTHCHFIGKSYCQNLISF